MSKDGKVSYDLTECAICQEKFDFDKQVISQLECKHVYHKDCIWGWVSTKINKCADTGFDEDLD